MDAQEKATQSMVEETFAHARYFGSLFKLLESKLGNHKIYFSRLGGVTLSPMVAIANSYGNYGSHNFDTMEQAFLFALEEYKKAVQAEAIENHTVPEGHTIERLDSDE